MNKRNLRAGVIIVAATVIFVSVVLFFQASSTDEAEPQASVAPVAQIVYTDKVEPETLPYESTTYTRVYYPLTMDEREMLAEILAGKAANRTEACQRMVATVIFNDIMSCDCDITWAARKYTLDTPGIPNDQIYKVVDAVFYNGEYMLDPEVKWMNDKDHPSAFHDSLVVVCECDGMVFYKEHRPSVVPGGTE